MVLYFDTSRRIDELDDLRPERFAGYLDELTKDAGLEKGPRTFTRAKVSRV